MDHDAVLEALELAAAEPGGLDRLMAGDTATAAAVAAHLVGCEACSAELVRLRRISGLVRDVVATTLPPYLRDRTLAHVRSRGIPRGIPAQTTERPSALGDGAAPAATSVADRGSGRRGAVIGWVAAVAAAVVISVAATSMIVGGRLDERIADQDRAVRDLVAVANATVQVTAASDVRRVALAGPNDPGVAGTLLYSPTSTDLVVVATGLVEPPEGMQYGCWVDTGSGRERVGRMFFGGGLAYWVGPSPAVAGSTGSVTFGVSLVDASGAISGPDPVLVGGS
jgi:anti-sigma factor RsiW